MSDAIPWGCWRCGPKADSRVQDSGLDVDGVRVRLRVCLSCGDEWETEERRLAPGSFYARSQTRRDTAYRNRRLQRRECKVCGGPYLYGTYAAHKRTPLHAAAAAEQAAKVAERYRAYQREYERRRRKLAAERREMERAAGLRAEQEAA